MPTATGEAIGWATEAARILDVGRRGGGKQGREIQNVEDVEEIGTKGQLGSFAQEGHMRQREILGRAQLVGIADRLAAHHAVRGEVWEKAVAYLRQAAAKAASRASITPTR